MKRNRYGLGIFITEIVMIALAAAFLFPIFILINMSLKGDGSADPLALPTKPTFDNYVEAWNAASLGQALMNSTVVAGLSVALLVLIGSSAAYVLSRRRGRMSYWMYLLFLLGLMLPLQLGMVPLYQLMNQAGLLSTYTSVILFTIGTQLPITVFLYAGFIGALPREYEEAAHMDGASHWATFRRVVFPLLKPITATVIILDTIYSWNEFLTPLLYLGGSPQQTLPVAIVAFRGEYSTQWGILFAGIIIAIIPILIAYLFLQKYIIQGFSGGLKG